ncbi:MAG TPA: hypothetical protein VKD72_09170 [Gemmataceae bacterium]|nr:hypothetical protein [Gemmataceae bacterium]
MFEKVGRVAERVALGMSRRSFLGRIGPGALALAAAVGGLLAAPGAAYARGRNGLPCGPDSFPGCQFAVTGSSCTSSPGCYGTCVYLRGTTICGCSLGKHPPRHCD